MADRNTGIDGSQIKNLSIKPEDLKRTGSAPTDGQIPSYDFASEDFEWGDAGAGDMLKSAYDTDNDGIVDSAENVDDGASGDAHKSTAEQVRDAVDKKHSQNTDTELDSGGSYSITAQQIVSPKYLVGDVSALGGLSNEILTKNVGLQNLLLNGNFEYWYSGTTSAPDGWTSYLSPIITRETNTSPVLANYHMKITADQDSEGIQILGGTSNYLKVKKSTVYTISFYYKVDSGDASRIIVKSYNGATGGTTHIDVNTLNAVSWTLYSNTFTTDVDVDNIQIRFVNVVNTDVSYICGFMLVEGSAPFAYTPHPEDHLYKQSVKHISPLMAMTIRGTGSIGAEAYVLELYCYCKEADGSISFHFEINREINGHPTIIDNCKIFYIIEDGDGATSNTADYIDRVRIRSNDQDGTPTDEVDHTANIGDDSYSIISSHDIIDTAYQMTGSDHWLTLNFVHDITLTDIKIMDIEVKYHTKVCV